MSLNTFVGIGRLTRDPDVRYNPNTQVAVARFTIAIDSGYGDNKRTDFPSIVVFGKMAEVVEKYLKKGSQVAVQGRLQTGFYEKDGVRHYTTDIIASNIKFLAKPKQDSNTSSSEQNDIPEGFAMIDEEFPF